MIYIAYLQKQKVFTTKYGRISCNILEYVDTTLIKIFTSFLSGSLESYEMESSGATNTSQLHPTAVYLTRAISPIFYFT